MADSWTHKLARVTVRPFLGTRLRPNHLTTLRLLTGLGSCALLATGTSAGFLWGGVVWVISAFLDRADGELARIGNMKSPGGHRYDYYSDTTVNSLFFIAIGFGLRGSWLGAGSIPLGLLSGVSMFLAGLFSEWLELRSTPGTRAYSGRWGFDPDDALYLMGPFAWAGWLSYVLVGASIGATAMMLLTAIRLQRLRSSPLV